MKIKNYLALAGIARTTVDACFLQQNCRHIAPLSSRQPIRHYDLQPSSDLRNIPLTQRIPFLVSDEDSCRKHFDSFLTITNHIESRELEVAFISDLFKNGLGPGIKALCSPHATGKTLQENYLLHAELACLSWLAYSSCEFDLIRGLLGDWNVEKIGSEESHGRGLLFYPAFDQQTAILALRGVGDNLPEEVRHILDAGFSHHQLTHRHHRGISALAMRLLKPLSHSLSLHGKSRLSMVGHSLGGAMVTILHHILGTIQSCQMTINSLEQLIHHAPENEHGYKNCLRELMIAAQQQKKSLRQEAKISDHEWSILASIETVICLKISDPPVSPANTSIDAIQFRDASDPVCSSGGLINTVMGESGLARLLGAYFVYAQPSLSVIFDKQDHPNNRVTHIITQYKEFDFFERMYAKLLQEASNTDEWQPRIDLSDHTFYPSPKTLEHVNQAAAHLHNYLFNYSEHYIGKMVMKIFIEHLKRSPMQLPLSNPMDALPTKRAWKSGSLISVEPTRAYFKDALLHIASSHPRCKSVLTNDQGDHFLLSMRDNNAIHGYKSNNKLYIEMKHKKDFFSEEHKLLLQIIATLSQNTDQLTIPRSMALPLTTQRATAVSTMTVEH